MQRRFKMKKEKVRVNIYIDKELWLESGYFIDNLSAYFNKCLQNAVDKHKQQKDNEERLRIIENRNKEERLCQEDIQKILSYNWISGNK